ncbi:MAG: metallophosphatase family protein [candidate division WOR-3 bacterium]|nr:metallophosphatase family protein [candidate division WOR-3 bacterium]
MRIAVFSDIHSNLEALQAVLDFLSREKIDQFLCLGDIVGYGANPNECVEMIKNLNCLCVAGNHDWGVLDKTDIANFNEPAQVALLWTKHRLNKESREYLAKLPLKVEWEKFFLVHATPKEPADWHYIYRLNQAEAQFQYFNQPIGLIGHSHYPIIIEQNIERKQIQAIQTHQVSRFNIDCRYLINVGSVGQPRDGDCRACVVIIDNETNGIRCERIEYNIKLAQQKILKSGLPSILAHRLALGK